MVADRHMIVMPAGEEAVDDAGAGDTGIGETRVGDTGMNGLVGLLIARELRRGRDGATHGSNQNRRTEQLVYEIVN